MSKATSPLLDEKESHWKAHLNKTSAATTDHHINIGVFSSHYGELKITDVVFTQSFGEMRFSQRLTPDEARELGQALIAASTECEKVLQALETQATH